MRNLQSISLLSFGISDAVMSDVLMLIMWWVSICVVILIILSMLMMDWLYLEDNELLNISIIISNKDVVLCCIWIIIYACCVAIITRI